MNQTLQRNATHQSQPYVDESVAFDESLVREQEETEAVMHVIEVELKNILARIKMDISEYQARVRRFRALDNKHSRILAAREVALISQADALTPKERVSDSDVDQLDAEDEGGGALVKRLEEMRNGRG